MRKVSLVIATLGERPDDLRALLDSLLSQADRIHEVIVVDQNDDQERVPHLLKAFQCSLPIRQVRSERGLSRARNHGLRFATGSLVAFPDDDCLYPSGLLEWVVDWFESHPVYDILAVGARDASGAFSGNRWPQDHCRIRSVNAFRTTFSSSLFLRGSVAATQSFDVSLGIGSGTRYGSGEETDYVLRLLQAGAKGRFDRSRHIVHPRRDMLSGEGSTARAEAYGFGMGHLLRRFSLRSLWAGFLTYNVTRAACAFMRGNTPGAGLCLTQTKGIWKGFLDKPTRGFSRDGQVPVASARAQRSGSSPATVFSGAQSRSLRNS